MDAGKLTLYENYIAYARRFGENRPAVAVALALATQTQWGRMMATLFPKTPECRMVLSAQTQAWRVAGNTVSRFERQRRLADKIERRGV